MRTLRRLFCILALVLLTGIVSARPAGTSSCAGAAVATPQFVPSSNHRSPSLPRLDFGTVVRDTADDESFEPAPRDIRYVLQGQVPQGSSLWVLYFVRSWVTFLLVAR